MQQTEQKQAISTVEQAVKLYLNQYLFDKGYISEQMFLTAKREILKL